VHSAHNPWLAGPASAYAARDGAARRASARRSGHRSPGVRRGAAGGGATVVEVEQATALKHPRRRGYPPGMGVEAIAHRSSLSTGRGRKTRSAEAFFDEVRASVAGGGPVMGRRERELSSMFHGRKAARRGSGSAHRGRARDGGALGQRRLASDTDDDAVGMSTWEARRGDGVARTVAVRLRRLSRCRRAVPIAYLRRAGGVALRGRVAATRRWHADRGAQRGKRLLTGGPHLSVFSELNLLPDENSSK
jgi:hypothetical protein